MTSRTELLGVPVRNPAIEALAGKHAQFGLGHVEPTAMFWSVMDLQLGGQLLGWPGAIDSEVRVSATNCTLVSSKHTTGRRGS